MIAQIVPALRSFRRSKGYTATALLTLAVGLSANAVIFSAVLAVLLRPLPFRAPERLVWIGHAHRERGVVAAFSPQDFDDLARSVAGPGRAFASLADYAWFPGNSGMTLIGAGEPLRVPVASVSGAFFSTLGMQAALGRPLLPVDDRPGSNHVVVLGDRLWHSRFGADRGVVGRKVTLDGAPYTIAGVMPPEMEFPAREVGIWAPLSLVGDDKVPHLREVRWLSVVGRLSPGVTPRAATTQATTVLSRLERQFAASNEGWGTAALRPLAEVVTGDVRPLLSVLFLSVGLVLLIICVNLANLSLARTMGRRGELAIRAALGATPARLAGQLLIESVGLALAGGALGLLMAKVGIGGLAGVAASYLPRADEIRLDSAVALFTLALAVACGFVFGEMSARQATGGDLRQALQQGSGASREAQGHGTRVLVVVQTALATLLLVGAGLLLRTFWQLQHVDPGFQAAHVLSLSISIPDALTSGPDGGTRYRGEIERRLRGLPGVLAVGGSHTQPLAGGGEAYAFVPVGAADPRPVTPQEGLLIVSAGYFHALGIPILRGRDFATRDEEGSAPPALIVSQGLAHQLWPGEDAVGKRLRDGKVELTVVGVVADVHGRGLATPAGPAVYAPLGRFPRSTVKLFVRTVGDPLSVLAAARRAIWQVNPEQPISEVAPLSQLVADDIGRPRLLSSLVAGFGGLAALLAALGIYGVTAQGVRRRTQEIGVRMALGADRARVVGLVVRQGMALALGGLACGLAAAFGLAHLLAGLLFGVGTADPPTYAGVTLLVAAAAFAASYLPAREAAAVDPLAAIKTT
ncbi:MAG TPA: ABC transporter permease [Thermoanaerobaculia bacterium]|nr:ABC transporter permease [Thermoanaerobaculia bacterium]